MYLGMSSVTGKAISSLDHIRQSIRDILTTPIGSRVMRREYGSLIYELIDQPNNPATRLRVMSAVVMALTRWEPRVELNNVDFIAEGSSLAVSINAVRVDQPGQPFTTVVNLLGNPI